MLGDNRIYKLICKLQTQHQSAFIIRDVEKRSTAKPFHFADLSNFIYYSINSFQHFQELKPDELCSNFIKHFL